MALLRLQTDFELDRFKVDIGAFTGFTSFESYDYTPVSNDDYVESYITTYVGSVISPSFRVNSGFLIGASYYYNFLEFRDRRLLENRNSTLTVDLVLRRTIKRDKPKGPVLTFPKKERKKLF